MGDMSKEPSMEEILSSIKRIIAEEGEDATRGSRVVRKARAEPASEILTPLPDDQPEVGDALMPEAEEVLELTDEIEMEAPVALSKTSKPAFAEAAASDEILSVESEVAARHSLSALSSMIVKPQQGEDNTLEALVRALLRPMLKEWLDENLPTMVEGMVAKEIARITGRNF